MPIEIVVEDQLADVLVPRIEGIAARAIALRGRFAIALPGGSVATTCFPRFAEAHVEWSRTHFFWSDERAVPATHPDSNYGVAEKLWLERIVGHAPTIHRMEAERADLDEAAQRYEQALREIGSLDLVLLGVGPDGHVASLFPGHALLDERDRWVAAIHDSPKPPPGRLTLTLPALRAAGEVIVVATGAAKADVVRELRANDASALPVAQVLRGAAHGLVVVDHAAAGG